MPWLSGSFSRVYGATGWQSDLASNIYILASRHDTHDQDLAIGIDSCLTRDNQSKPTASFLPASNNAIDLGSSSFFWRRIYGYLFSTEIKYAITPAETAAGVTPTDFSYLEGYLERYGGIGDDSANDLAALQKAVNVGRVIISKGKTFRAVGTVTKAGPVVITGFGPTSIIKADGAFLTLTAATGTIVSNCAIQGITAPGTIQRKTETTVITTAGTYNTSLFTTTVTSGTGIVKGMRASGYGLDAGTCVEAISGTNLTLSRKPVVATSGESIRFETITFATGAGVLTTYAASNAEGRYTPNVNDTDIWASLSGAQQAAAAVGPVVDITGDNITIEKVHGRGASILLRNCNNAQVLYNRMRGGYTWASIACLNFTDTYTKNAIIIGNDCQDHGFGGILAMGVDGVKVANNRVHGCGESGIKLYPYQSASPGAGIACINVQSSNNSVTACYQGAFDYNAPFLPTASPNAANCSSIGDYGAWCPWGAFGFSGSGWLIDVTAEMNGGCAIIANVSDSKISGVFRENMQANLNTSITNEVTVTGNNNTLHNARVIRETTITRAGYLVQFTGGATAATSGSFLDCDLRDNCTPVPNAYLVGGNYQIRNVRANGSQDLGNNAAYVVTPAYGTTVTIDAGVQGGLYTEFQVYANNGTAFAIAAPTNGSPNQEIVVTIGNSSGGALGAITWNAAYKMGAFTSPAAGTQRSIRFQSNGNATAWHEITRTTVDVPI